MSATNIRFKARAINADPITVPENGWVEGFYYQDLDNGIVKHYIHNCPCVWEVDPSTVRVVHHPDLLDYRNPITNARDIADLQKQLVQTVIDFIKERNLTDVYEVGFHVDGLEDIAIEFGEWMPAMDSSISVVGLQDEPGKKYRVRKLIGEWM